MLLYETTALESTTKNGKTKYWNCRILWDDQTGEVYTQQEYWQENGQHQFSTPKLVKPKNVGRSNEKSGMEQAHLEVASLVSKKQDEGYGNEEYPARCIFLPMLAHSYGDHFKKIQWPCYAQYKLDGHRMLYSKELGFWTRKGKPYLPEVTAHIQRSIEDNFTIGKSIILDGEVMLPHHRFSFQETTSAIKKFNTNTTSLVYHVYDLYDRERPELTFEERMEILELYYHNQAADFSTQVVMSWKLSSEGDVPIELELALDKGYEGIMLRNRNALYDPGHRSYDLQKVKLMDDAEFPIVGYTEGEARDAGAIIFICKDPSGKLFRVGHRGKIDARREMFKNGAYYIGKQLTVQYQGFTDDGSLRFPVGLRVREDA